MTNPEIVPNLERQVSILERKVELIMERISSLERKILDARDLDSQMREGPQPIRCSGCGTRWTSPEGFILAGVVHLCGNCWREFQQLRHRRADANHPTE